jgi:hypothetical protein
MLKDTTRLINNYNVEFLLNTVHIGSIGMYPVGKLYTYIPKYERVNSVVITTHHTNYRLYIIALYALVLVAPALCVYIAKFPYKGTPLHTQYTEAKFIVSDWGI